VSFPAGIEYFFHKQGSTHAQQTPERRHQEGLKWESKCSQRGCTKCHL